MAVPTIILIVNEQETAQNDMFEVGAISSIIGPCFAVRVLPGTVDTAIDSTPIAVTFAL